MIDKDGQRYTSMDSNRSLSSTTEKYYIFSNKNFVIKKQYLNNTKNGPRRAWNAFFTKKEYLKPYFRYSL